MSDNGNGEAHTADIELTAHIVSAYVEKNPIPAADLPALIASVASSLRSIAGRSAELEPEAPTPAVSIKKSVTPDYLVSLEDGKRYKALKRHLSRLGLTPDEYRAKWGLPRNYPMVAPNYSAARSELAKTMGLGRKSAAKRGRRKAA